MDSVTASKAVGGFTIHGARGTLPACGPNFNRYGGHTTCFSLRLRDATLIFDAGSGIASVPLDPPGRRVHLFFTHFHMDHLFGLPSFKALYDPAFPLTIRADPKREEPWRTSLHTFMRKPFWPVAFTDTSGLLSLEDLPENSPELTCEDTQIRWFRGPHPQGCLAYRIVRDRMDIVIGTDLEYTPDAIDSRFVDFCAGARHLIFDAEYAPDEYPSHRGWGHSTYETAARLAQAARVEALILTHHAPDRVDGDIESMVADARRLFPRTSAAGDGLAL